MSIDYEGVLYWKERTLQLVLALDKVRDSYVDSDTPHLMFDTFAGLLRDQMAAAACAIAVTDEDGKIAYLANAGFEAAEAEALCREALGRPGTGPLSSTRWPHTLGLQIILQRLPLAGLALARESEPFSVQEVGLLSVAESQLDSAVLQVRTLAELRQRNRELEAIFQIDRLRDTVARESDLLSGFTSLVMQHFDGTFGLIAVCTDDSDEYSLRADESAMDLPQAALDAICQAAGRVNVTQQIAPPAGLDDVRLLAAPMVVGGQRYGTVVVGRERPFRLDDARLIAAMVSQMDAAVAETRTMGDWPE